MYNRADVFLFHDFRKRSGGPMILGVGLLANNLIFTSVPGHGDKSTPLNRTVVSCNLSGARNPKNNSEAVNLFLI